MCSVMLWILYRDVNQPLRRFTVPGEGPYKGNVGAFDKNKALLGAFSLHRETSQRFDDSCSIRPILSPFPGQSRLFCNAET